MSDRKTHAPLDEEPLCNSPTLLPRLADCKHCEARLRELAALFVTLTAERITGDHKTTTTNKAVQLLTKLGLQGRLVDAVPSAMPEVPT